MIPQAETGFAHLLPLFPYEIKISHSLTPKFFPMFEGQPKGLFALALANTGERFGYYTMLAVFVLFLQDNFGWSAALAGSYYSTFLMFVYFLPFIGGILADKFGYGRMVTIGISIMFLGYLLLSFPLGNGTPAVIAIIGALALICMGTGLFKGNLQVMVGDLYKSPELAGKRDAAFSIFYMAINIGALFAPSAAVKIMEYAQNIGFSKADSYHFAFAVACVSLIISMLIYFASRSTFRHVEGKQEKADSTEENKAKEEAVELSPADTRARIVALCLVFAVVIFFWMAFHQNGLTLTYFAAEFTQKTSTGIPSMLFDVRTLLLCIVSIYAAFAVVQSKTTQGRVIATAVVLVCAALLIVLGLNVPAETKVAAPIFQQFNPCFVVGLTPISVALFGWLAARGKEPSAPRKIAYGMIVAAIGFGVMIVASLGIKPLEEQVTEKFNIDEATKEKTANIDKEAQKLIDDRTTRFNENKEKIQAELNKRQKQVDETAAAQLKEVTDPKEKSEITKNVTILKANNSCQYDQITEITRLGYENEVNGIKSAAAQQKIQAQAVGKMAKAEVEAKIESGGLLVSPGWLILTYLVLTFAELLLSPMGISFVSKVAPPKYKGMMMGGWFVATAVGNFLTVIPALLWCKVPLYVVWTTLAVLCLLSFIFIFSQMKRLEKVG